jgi:hypothetical protein
LRGLRVLRHGARQIGQQRRQLRARRRRRGRLQQRENEGEGQQAERPAHHLKL